MAVLQAGDNQGMEGLYKLHISEMRHRIVQYHLPTRDVQAIFLYRVQDHIRALLGHQVLWVSQPVESGVIATLLHHENLTHQTEEVFIQVQNMFLREDKTRNIKPGIIAIVISISSVQQIEIVIEVIDLVTLVLITHYKVLIVDHRWWETIIIQPNRCPRPTWNPRQIFGLALETFLHHHQIISIRIHQY